MQATIKKRTIFCRDNIDILQGIDTESIDLIYLDPPFNKKKTFYAPMGSSAEGAAFNDIFRKEDVKEEWVETIKEDNVPLYELLDFSRKAEGRTSYNFCYLAYMAIRLMELYRVLKDTGSIYLHCDPTMSHYLKLAMDCVFGEKNFRNEIVWGYKGPGNTKRYFPQKHDIIYYYVKNKGSKYTFNPKEVLIPYSEAFLKRRLYAESKQGKGITAQYSHDERTESEVKKKWGDGQLPTSVWTGFSTGGQMSNKERMGYPTQKPLALLERIIKVSSNENDMVLDPFCGCATTCVAAEKLNRQWIGIDISVKAYELVKKRLKKEVELKEEMPLFYEELVNFETSPPLRTDLGKNPQKQKWVYIISHSNFPGEYKVGIAKNWKSRLNSYQTSDPERAFKIEYKKLTPKFREIEKYIHEKFDNKHEWVSGELKEIIHEIENYKVEELHPIN